MTYPFASASDVGQRRDHNEDSVYATPPVFAVADGVGGSARGEVASRTALDAFVELATNVEHARAADDAVTAMEHAVLAANTAVFEAQRDNDQLRGMATTLTATVVRDGGELIVGHVGDSRLYLLNATGARLVSDDHSVVAELVRTGRLNADEAPHHPQRNVITRALGPEADVSVDAFAAHCGPGDWLLVCSDGLTEHVDEDELARIVLETVRRGTPNDAVAALVARANERGGTDNITVAIAQPVPSDVSGELSLQALRRAEPRTTQLPIISDAPAEASGPLPVVEPAMPVRDARSELPDMEPLNEPDEPIDVSRRARSRGWAVGILVLLLAAAIGGVAWSQSYFLLARSDGTVGINRGFPVWRLSVPHRGSHLAVTSVDAADRERFVNSHTIRSQSDAEKLLGQLEQQSTAESALNGA